MSEQEALDRIAALHVESDRDYDYPHVGTHCTACSDDWPCATAAVLAQGYTEGRAAGWDERGALGGVLDRDQARAVLDRFRRGEQGVEVTLDHLAQFVRPAAIDRDALDALLFAFAAAVQKRRSEGEGFDIRPWLDRFVALVRPVAARQYPYLDGPHLILGPECFTGDGDEFPQDVIMWRGAAYSRGVTLTPEEATYARRWLPTANSQRARDLAARLEAGS